MKKINDHSLYLVISEECGCGRSAIEIAKRAIEGGVDIIQMREKNRSKDELIGMGKDLARICKANNVIFIVNDDPFLAAEVGADGVHFGQEDALKYPIDKVRRVLGPDKIIGISTHSMAQFTAANDGGFDPSTRPEPAEGLTRGQSRACLGVDYIAFGPIFETKTKGYFLGAENVGEVIRIAKRPVFFIGGINLANIGDILKRGAQNIALIRGITEAEDMTARTREFKRLLGPPLVKSK